MIEQIDILVVGLGPAGACAAKTAALSGHQVLAIDKKTRAGEPVQCAEFVPALIGTEVAALSSTSVQPIVAMTTKVEDQEVEITPDFPGLMIDRAKFDRQLGQEAANAGAELLYASKLTKVSSNGQVKIANGRVFKPKVIIAADGPRSIIGSAINSPITDILETRQINVNLLKPFSSTDIFLSHQIPGGYAWAFPKGDQVNIGLGVNAADKHRLKPYLDKLHQELIDNGRVATSINSTTGGAIPASGMVKPYAMLGSVLCLLAGDAAGLTNPITGAGINSAVISGKLAAEAAAKHLQNDQQAAEDYGGDLEDLFGPSLDRALAHRTRLNYYIKQQQQISPDQLRSGWIAFPQFWQQPIINPAEEQQCRA